MATITALRRCLLCLLLLTTVPTVAHAQAAGTQPQVLEVFVCEGCPHCAAAKRWLDIIAAERPELHIRLRQVDQDANARDDLLRLSRQAGYWPPGVPTFVVGERVLVGFDDAEHSGAQLLAMLADTRPAVDKVASGMFGTLSVERLGLPLFTLAMGLLDGFNPCAMWVLLFLLSLLVHLRERTRMALIAGTFVLVSGLVYYAFMAAWLNLFLLVGLSRPLLWGLGALAISIGLINLHDGLRPGNGFSLSIPATAKPGLYARMRRILQAHHLLPALVGVATLAVVVNFIELLCTAGLPAIYTAVLTQQNLSPLAHYAYLGLYILGYIADDALMVTLAVLALSSRKLSPAGGRNLKLLSAAVMLGLGSVMLLRPEWLQT
jgi:glutaredoxin